MSLLENEKKADERDKSVSNERTKLTATFLNGVAVAVIAVGGLAPLFAKKDASPIAPPPPAWVAPTTLAVCLVVGVILHWLARTFLKEMR